MTSDVSSANQAENITAFSTMYYDKSKALGGQVNNLRPHPKPWCICHLGVQVSILRRYANRQDAENDLRLITKFVPVGQYAIAFDVIETQTEKCQSVQKT